MTDLEKLRRMIDEDNYPYFDDDYLGDKIDEIGTRKDITLESIAKELCLTKAGIEEIKLGDITISSPRKHFMMLASRYRGSHTGTVVRADER